LAVRRYVGTAKEEALIYLGELRKAAKEGKLDELIRPAKILPGTAFGEYARGLLDLKALPKSVYISTSDNITISRTQGFYARDSWFDRPAQY